MKYTEVLKQAFLGIRRLPSIKVVPFKDIPQIREVISMSNYGPDVLAADVKKLIELDNKVVGAIFIKGKTIFIAILPKYQGMGIGQAAASQLMTMEGIPSLTSYTIKTLNGSMPLMGRGRMGRGRMRR